MITEFPVFTPITASNVHETAELAFGYEQYASFNPVALWCWNRGYPGGVSRLDGNLVIRWKDATVGLPYLSFAAHDAFRQTATTLLDYAGHHDLSPCLRAIPMTVQEIHTYAGDEFNVRDDRDNFEYLLSVDEWAQLRGAAFRNMRNAINKLERRHPLSVRVLSLEDEAVRKGIARLCNRWATQRGVSTAQFLPERTAIQNLFDYIPSSEVFVLGAYVDDTLIGFSINECLDNGVGIGHFAKADYAYSGLYTYLLHHVCIRLQERSVEVLNIEEDLGNPGLRQAKLLLKPTKLLEKAMICPNSVSRIVPAQRQMMPSSTAASVS